MSFTCPQCGAVFTTEETCQDRFNVSQLKEIAQPAYYAVHHLSVPCYMLQHNVYSRQGWKEVRTLLEEFVYEGWTPAMARRHLRATAESGHRAFSFTRAAKLPGVEDIAWSYTIADVRLDTAESYCADVRRWVESILADSEQIVCKLDNAA
jgi:Family of unknown function (DUF5946)